MAGQIVECPSEIRREISEVEQEHYQGLGQFEMLVIARTKATRKGGRPVVVEVRKPDPLLAYFLSLDGEQAPDLIVIVALDCWEALSDAARRYQIDRALASIEITDDGEPEIVTPDVQTFAHIVGRHDLDAMGAEMHCLYDRLQQHSGGQMGLFDAEGVRVSYALTTGVTGSADGVSSEEAA